MPRVEPAEKRLRQALAANVRGLRADRAWSLEEAADRTTINWRHLQKIEAGEVSITLRTLAHLATGFQTTAATLLTPRVNREGTPRRDDRD